MKKLMKLMTALAVTAFAVGAYADTFVADATAITAANRTVFTNEIVIGGAGGFRSIEKIVVKDNSTSAAACVFAINDFDEVYTTYVTNGIAAASSDIPTLPLRAVANGSTTNAPYYANKVRVITTLAATNAVVSTVKFRIYAGENIR